MAAFFFNGRIVDLIVLFMLAEAITLVTYRLITRRGLNPFDVALMLLPGLLLLLALRAALIGSAWHMIAMLLVLALIAHLGELWRRMRLS